MCVKSAVPDDRQINTMPKMSIALRCQLGGAEDGVGGAEG